MDFRNAGWWKSRGFVRKRIRFKFRIEQVSGYIWSLYRAVPYRKFRNEIQRKINLFPNRNLGFHTVSYRRRITRITIPKSNFGVRLSAAIFFLLISESKVDFFFR